MLTQVSALQAALDRVSLGALDGHARHSLLGDEAEAPDGADARADELMAAVGRLLKR